MQFFPPHPTPLKKQRTLYRMLSFWRPCTSLCSRTKVFCSLACLDLTLVLVICILFLSNICLLSSVVRWSYLDIQFSNEVCEWFPVPLHSILYYFFFFLISKNDIYMNSYSMHEKHKANPENTRRKNREKTKKN